MGNNCCGNRHKKPENDDHSTDWTTRNTTKDSPSTKSIPPSMEKTGECPYCSSKIQIPFNLKYLECSHCKEKSMQDGCTTTLYK
jgi:ribosomal protein L37AE/L43A